MMTNPIDQVDAPVRIYTLGSFEIYIDGVPLHFPSKVQRRPLALLKALIAFATAPIPEMTLIDRIWPDAHGEAAQHSLTSALHRLRRLLRSKNIVLRRNRLLSLDTRHCWVDLWALESALDESDALFESNASGISFEEIAFIERALELYRGGFLDGEQDLPWNKPVADRLRRRVVNRLLRVGQCWEQQQQQNRAARHYERALAIDPCAEDICRALMSLYHQVGRPTEVISLYEQLREALKIRAGLGPSQKTEALFRQPIGR